MREILNRFVKTSAPHGLTLWTDGQKFSARHYFILTHLMRPDPRLVEILKQSDRRSVLRIKALSPEYSSLIVKGFPLRKIESKWKYKKYGLAEFENYQQAAQRQIPAPKCHGYFEVRGFGLVRANGVILEDLDHHQSLARRAETNADKRMEIFLRAIPLLKLLFEKGVNHIDVSAQNLMERPEGSDLRLIDWQYCAFVPPRQTAQLLVHAAHFLKYANVPAASPEGRFWLETLLSESGGPMSQDQFVANVATLQNGPKLSSETRLKLDLQFLSA